MAALGYVIQFTENPQSTTVTDYWNGRGLTEGATNTELQESETFLDSELSEADLYATLANVQLAHLDKHATLRRVSVEVTLV